MSMIGSMIADSHNKVLDYYVKKFNECETFEEFLTVLEEFKDERFSE